MAYNNMISGYLNSFQPQTWNRSTAGDPIMNQANNTANYAANRADQRRDIEWANRQQMYDPGYWASAFGVSGGSTPSAPRDNWYESRLKSLLDNPDSIANTGAYKFAFGQGQEAINRQLAAKGLLNSGNRLYELTKFGQGLASQQFGSEVDRLSNLAARRDVVDTQRYAVDQQGNNQLRSMMMQNMLNRLDRQEARTPQYW